MTYKFWAAKSHWGAGVFFMLVLLFTSLAFTGIPKAKAKIVEFYAYTDVDPRSLVTYLAREKRLAPEEAGFLVQQRSNGAVSTEDPKQIVPLFYVFVSIVAAGLVPLMVKFHRIGLIYLMRIFRVR